MTGYATFDDIVFEPETAPEAYLLNLLEHPVIVFKCCDTELDEDGESWCCCIRSFPVVRWRGP